MRSIQKDLQRAFIHEIGHLVAAELNYSLFNYDRRIDLFKLKLRDGSSMFYDGAVKTNNVPKSNRFNLGEVANYYTNLVYGCLFESLQREINLKQCLCEISIKENLEKNIGNGHSDFREICRVKIIESEIKSVIDKWDIYVFNDYYNEMRELKINNHFDSIFYLDPTDFILNQKSSKEQSIDIGKVKIAVNDFLKLHKPYFKSFLEKLQEIQNHKN